MKKQRFGYVALSPAYALLALCLTLLIYGDFKRLQMQIFTGNVSLKTRSPSLSSREKIFRILPFRVYLDKFASGIGLCVKRDPRESTKKSREGSEQTTFVYYTPSHQQYFLPLPQLFRGQWGAFWTLQFTLCVRLIGKNASSFMKDSLFLLIIPTHLIFSNTPERNIKNNLLFAVFFLGLPCLLPL